MVMAEKALIAQIRRAAARRKSPAVITGIGDDCAILRLAARGGKQAETLVTTDFSLEGIHFRREWHSPESIAQRCLTRGLSDIAAMGGKPVAAFLSLALPSDLPQSWVDRFSRRLMEVAEKNGLALAGGDTAQSPAGILADIVLVGSVPRGKAILRSGARPGDLIYVSGELGGSAAAVLALEKNPQRKLGPRKSLRHFYPQARIELGRILREKELVSAMIDTSDGLSTDLAHICEESGVGAELQAEAIPRAKVGKTGGKVDLDLALHGGEDYELLFTAPLGKQIPSPIKGVRITQIGRIIQGRRVFLNRAGKRHELLPQGWEHFRKR
jgi:thiamine-monophosphate kinase